MSHPEDAQHPNEKNTHDETRPLSGRLAIIIVIVGIALAAVLAVAGILPRLHAKKDLQNETDALAPPDVEIARPNLGVTDSTVQLPGALQPYIDSGIYARTAGYLRKWYFDIGAHVHEGQLLGIIESPEVDQQLVQARADLATAQANAGNAVVQAKRYQDLLNDNAVSQQDTDNFVTQRNSTQTQVASAQANVNRLEQLVGFERITAPFTGILTARSIDEGQLIDAGATREIFHMQQTNTLRVYVAVPEVYTRGTRPGVHADLTLAEYPGQHFDGVVVRTTRSIDPTTRTLLTEVDVPNRNEKLLPGAYAEVHFRLPEPVRSLVINVQCMLFRTEGLRVAVVGANNRIKLVPITVGKDDGRTVEIVSGLRPDDEIVQNPPDSIVDNELVHPVRPQAQNQQGPGTAAEHNEGKSDASSNTGNAGGAGSNGKSGGSGGRGQKGASGGNDQGQGSAKNSSGGGNK
jgi:RND family efflux transporter MFP subunit